MAYTPPDNDAVNFDFKGTYTPPASDSVDLEIPLPTGEGTVDCPAFGTTSDVEVDIQPQLSVSDFEQNSDIGSEVHRLLTAQEFGTISDMHSDILWYTVLDDFEQNSELESEVLWFTILTDFEQNSEFESPGVLLQISLPGFEGTGELFGTTSRRIQLEEFNSYSVFGVGFIAEIEAGVEAVGCWPFENTTRLEKPVLVHILVAEFNQDTNMSTPVIVANDFAGIVAEAFETNSELYSDIQLALNIPDFEQPGELDVLAIKTMPAGDLYLVCPEWASSTVFEVPIMRTGVIIPDFEQSSVLAVEALYSGYVVDTGEFEQTSDLNAVTYPVIVLTEFENNTELLSDVMPSVSAPDFEQTSVLSSKVQTGVFVAVPDFVNQTTMEVEIPISVLMEDFEQNSNLEVSTIAEFISVPEFNVSSELLVSAVRLFTLENSQIYYFFVITGDGDSVPDIEIPFTSVQARRRNTKPTYVTVAIPSLEYASAINERAGNKMQVYMGYRIDRNTAIKQLILETNIDQINIYEGPIKQSIVLIGYETEAHTAKTITLEKPIYTANVGGKISHRFAIPKIDLRPGDTAQIGLDTLLVDTISLYIKNTKSGPISTMEIGTV